MGDRNWMETDILESSNRLEGKAHRKKEGPICELLSTLPPNSTLTEILVDGVPFTVSAFINVDTDRNLAYFTSVIGTTLIVDCHRLTQVIF